jgi:capsule polysaccharide export protein KpsE/RkpR
MAQNLSESLVAPPDHLDEDSEDGIGLVEVATWLGEGKWWIVGATIAAAIVASIISVLIPSVYTARTTLLPPGMQQQSGSAAALAALGSLGGLAGASAKTSDELYVALLNSDSLLRGLDQRFDLRARYHSKDFETLRSMAHNRIRVTSDKKSGLITLEVDDGDPKFAASLANAHLEEITKVLSRLAVNEAQQRRVFFERQMKETKENLVKAEADLRDVQERSGIVVLEKQAEAVIAGAGQVRTAIADREVRLRVLRTSATDQSPDVMRLNSELQGLRAELARLESRKPSDPASGNDLPVAKLPEASVAYVRARRELKLQEVLMEAMIRQFEAAKLDEAKEGPLLQQVDEALAPNQKSKPARKMIVGVSTLAALILASLAVVLRRSASLAIDEQSESVQAWRGLKAAWRWRASPSATP